MSVSDKAVSKWERGLSVPDISILSKLSMVLRVDIESILFGEKGENKETWRGVLCLDYPKEVNPISSTFGKLLVELQIGYFLLAGIGNITVYGPQWIDDVRRLIKDGKQYGVHIDYYKDELCNLKNFTNDVNGLMIISKPFFLWGKDITRLFRRQMYECNKKSQLIDLTGEKIGIEFRPPKAKTISGEIDVSLERGVLNIKIEKKEDLLDVSNIIKIIESHQEEEVGNLLQIAKKREFIK